MKNGARSGDLTVLLACLSRALEKRAAVLEERERLNGELASLEALIKRDREVLRQVTESLLRDPVDARLEGGQTGRPVTRTTEHQAVLAYVRTSAGLPLDFVSAAKELYGGDGGRQSQKRISFSLAYLMRRKIIRRVGRRQYVLVESEREAPPQTDEETKICVDCGDPKPVGDFYLIRRGGTKRQTRCKPCGNRLRASYFRVDPSGGNERWRALSDEDRSETARPEHETE